MLRISLIIPTYNRGEKIYLTLDSIAMQTLDPLLWEVVVVNNNSTDNTTQLLESYTKLPNMRWVTELNQGASHTRNRGIAEAKGDILLFIDDDETINREFMAEYLNFFDTHPDVSVVGGRVIANYEEYKPKWVTKYTEALIAGVCHYSDHTSLLPSQNNPNSGNMGLRSRVLESNQAFDTTLGRSGGNLMAGEERELVKRLRSIGEPIYYLPSAVIYHHISQSRWSFDYIRRVSYMLGISEGVRTKSISKEAYMKRLIAEGIKWCAVVVLMLKYTLMLSPSKGWALVVMRWHISRGLLRRSN